MLTDLEVRGFKSLVQIEGLSLPRMAILFGPNAVGKSNFLDAILALSRIGTSRTLGEALQGPIRGHAIEAFTIPDSGISELLERNSAEFRLNAGIEVDGKRYSYRVGVRINPRSGSLTVCDEYLAELTVQGKLKGKPSIEIVGNQLRIRRKGKPAHPRQEVVGLNHTMLSDPRLGSDEYLAIESCRREMSAWRTYYLDPRVAMRRAASPKEVYDIGALGEDIGPFLYRLNEEKEPYFRAIVRTLRSIIPGVDDVTVEPDKRRGTLDIFVRQNGVEYPSRIVSEGTLRVLALCAISVNPWSGSLVAFEEPENGVHPRRLELIAQLLASLSLEQGRQLIVTTHSPLFCSAILKKARKHPEQIGLFNVRKGVEGTTISQFETTGPLFDDAEIAEGLAAKDDEDAIFEGLVLRGMLDE